MASPPASTRTSLGQKLRARARERWPQLSSVDVRFRGKFAYVTGQLPDGQDLPLCRLRYGGYASLWGFAIYRASHDDYQDSVLPSGQFAGTPEEALDCACGLYLGDPGAWLPPEADTPTNLRAGPLAGPLLATAAGGRLRQGHLWELVRRLARTARVRAWEQLSPHSLRHSAITFALDAGATLRDVQDYAGHKDPRTTRRYDHSRDNLDRNAAYTVAAYLA